MSNNQQVFPVGLTLAGKTVAVVGGEREAADKVGRLLDAGADVAVYAPEIEHEQLARWRDEGRIKVVERWLEPDEVADQALVLSTRFDAAYNDALSQACRGKRILVSCFDQPERSDFSMPAVVKSGLLRMAIFTAGASPILASRIRQTLEKAFDQQFARWLDRLGEYREQVKRDEPEFEKRREALGKAVDGFELEVKVKLPE